MKIGKRSFSIKGLLLLADSAANELFSLDKSGAYKLLHSSSELSIDDYFPSEVERIVSRLLRHGLVEKVATKEGVKIVLTENGKRQALLFKLDEIKPKSGHWDGKWRIVFFDVEETQRKKETNFANSY